MSFHAGGRYLVIGLGRTGLPTVDVLRSQGAQVVATDEKDPPTMRDVVSRVEAAGARFCDPAALMTVLPHIDTAVLSPGVPRSGALVRSILAAGIPIISEIEVAYQLCKAPIIAVTGTKGKSTVTALAAHLFAAAGKNVLAGGNIGNALIKEAVSASKDDWVIAEISSFQLESIRDFRPRISVLLNIAPDHLDRYDSMDEYAAAKYRIFENQDRSDIFIGNLEDPRILALYPERGTRRVRAQTLWFTAGGAHRELASLFAYDGTIWRAREPGGDAAQVMRCSDIPLPGTHNVENVLAALSIAFAAGCDPAGLGAAITRFRGMPHRLQTIAEIGGTRYVDDSKATNPAAVIAALHAFAGGLVLIAGGKSKRTDFRQMGQAISARAKSVVLFGEAADEIAASIAGPPIERASSMDDAVVRAARAAQAGDVVLLSPGCASFDMFDSAEHRGDVFAACVQALGAVARA